jgi:hypothetical protein
MNVNDRNAILEQLHGALDGRQRVLDNPRVSAEQLLRAAEELKSEDARYEKVQVRKTGPTEVAFVLED